MNKTIVVINDVCDDNGRARQQAKCNILLGQVPIFLGVKNDLEASGEIIDQHANLRGEPGIIIAQSAPRTTETNKTNGTGFCYFWVENTLFITSVKGHMLSLVRKFGLTKKVRVINSEAALTLLNITEMKDSQFRSLEWLFEFAAYLKDGKDLPHNEVSIEDFPIANDFVWHIDEWKNHTMWGNCKLSITGAELRDLDTLSVLGKNLKIYERLKDVPEGELGIVRVGSSGILGQEFAEIAVGNGNAAAELGISVGDFI
ncbi:MAG: hypothetical protein ACK4FA_00945 [Candidatus Paceibacteria bacterium]